MTLLRRFWDAAVALDPFAADRDEGRCMPFCTPAEHGELWSSAGLDEVEVAPLGVGAGSFRLEARAWVVTGRA